MQKRSVFDEEVLPVPYWASPPGEYDRTIESLFGFTSDWGGQFTAEVVEVGFDNRSDALTVTITGGQLQAAAGASLFNPLARLCPVLCALNLVAPQISSPVWAPAFRRPLTEQDLQRYLTLFSYAADLDGFSAGVS